MFLKSQTRRLAGNAFGFLFWTIRVKNPQTETQSEGGETMATKKATKKTTKKATKKTKK
jgi:hypothetical protein